MDNFTPSFEYVSVDVLNLLKTKSSKSIPTVFYSSNSYYEILSKIKNIVSNVQTLLETTNTNTQNLKSSFTDLKLYITNLQQYVIDNSLSQTELKQYIISTLENMNNLVKVTHYKNTEYKSTLSTKTIITYTMENANNKIMIIPGGISGDDTNNYKAAWFLSNVRYALQYTEESTNVTITLYNNSTVSPNYYSGTCAFCVVELSFDEGGE